MTAPQQEFKEYTLTINLSVHPEMREKSLRDYIHSQIFTDNWIGAFRTNYILATEFQFRSRPLTSAAPLEGVFKDFDNNAVEWLKQHDTAIRKAEREKVLDAISACVGQWIPFGSDPTAVMAREIKEKIESLRSEQHER